MLLLQLYDVGDLVQLSNVAGGATHRVMAINVLTTELEENSSLKRVAVRNADVIGMAVTNLRLSANARLSPVFVVDHDQLRLKSRLPQ